MSYSSIHTKTTLNLLLYQYFLFSKSGQKRPIFFRTLPGSSAHDETYVDIWCFNFFWVIFHNLSRVWSVCFLFWTPNFQVPPDTHFLKKIFSQNPSRVYLYERYFFKVFLLVNTTYGEGDSM